MSVGAEKARGFAQGIHEISSSAKDIVGTLRTTRDGRRFRYAKAGGALSVGKMGVAAVPVAAHINETPDATAVGSHQVKVTVTAGTALVANELAGGYLSCNDAAAEGHQYLIESNSALGAAGTEVWVNLVEPIIVALTTASEVSLVKSPWYGVTESTTEENLPAGVAPMAVTSAYYYWAQTHGIATVLCAGTPAVGTMLTLSATAGALAAINATLDIDQPIVAIQHGTAGVSGEYKLVFLMID